MTHSAGVRLLALLLVCAMLPIAGCRGATVGQELAHMSFLGDVPDTAWANLAKKRVFFGHQSVGANIMEGVGEIIREGPRIGLKVVGDEAGLSGDGGVFAHWAIGRNGDPQLKTDEFARLIEGPLRGRVDVVLHKYCYADISEGTNVRAVFDHYRQTMDRLRTEYPNVVFVHVTTPLVRVQSGPKAVIKRWLGRGPAGYESNMAREQFNDLMREAYRGREPLFDLAAVESTRPDGTRETIRFGGRSSYALVPAYTSDGSHLDQRGRRRVAEELLVLLARLSASR
jgi:hypothetical protein